MSHEGDSNINDMWRPWNDPRYFGKVIRELEIWGRSEIIQTTALMRSAEILRRILETWGYLSFCRQWKAPVTNCAKKTNKLVNSNYRKAQSGINSWRKRLGEVKIQWELLQDNSFSSLQFIIAIILLHYIPIPDIGIMIKVFVNGPGDLGSIPGRVIPKSQKWYLMPPCLTLSIIRYRSRVKWDSPGKGVSPSLTLRGSSYWKGSLRVNLDLGRQLYWLTFQKNKKEQTDLKNFKRGGYFLHIFTKPSTRVGCDPWLIFKQNLTGLKSVVPF